MEYGGFGKKSGPTSSTNPDSSHQFFANAVSSPPNPSSSTVRSPRPFVQPTHGFGDGQRPFGHSGAQYQRQRPSSSPSMVASAVASRSSENSVSLKVSRSQHGNSGGFNQPVAMRNNPSPGDFRPSSFGVVPIRQSVYPRTNSPQLAYNKNNHAIEGYRPSVGARPVRYTASPRSNSPEQARHQFVDLDSSLPSITPGPRPGPVRPAAFRNSFDNRPRSPVSYANLQALQNQPPVSPYHDLESSQYDDVQGTNQTRSPTSQADEDFHFPRTNSERCSSPELSTISNLNSSTHNTQAPRKSLPRFSNQFPEAAATNPTSFPVMKRSRSPPVSTNKVPTGNFNDIQDDEREMQAKAKRLARFKVELGEKLQSSNDDTELKASTNLHEPSMVGRNKSVPEHSTELNDGFSSELEGSSVSGVVIGLCTDMCPESERAERERKGDLDRFERLDGDRNQTSKSLAVKKYNRTAEREANLIRPMPILQKTMEYLLNLLDQPYNDKFLGTYNFLWDRMRAIRMDLRMQHIFNQAAITMLEQMIRLHIIAMHELCEYSKGEGFSEGFDAHLNIEQMNKTSVELFQMYDDHRKKGIVIPTEEEFRGYYALLKLDKHPGYMVEPAELSLDLAKMTPEIRQTNEVLFARDVARACRTGNFIAFFRLARKASYLQACLMHAHFAKLRTQALASLHAGLQNNQGLPVIHVAEWLAMEEEDMESLLEYHGFLIKVFDEPYVVKDGPFLNGEKDYDTRCSKLVDMKKSGSILEDAVPTKVITPTKVYQSVGKKISPTKIPTEIKMVQKNDNVLKVFPSDGKKRPVRDIVPVESSPVYAVDEDMADSGCVPSPKGFKVMQPMPEIPVLSKQRENDHHLPGFNSFSWEFSLPKPLPSMVINEERPGFDNSFINFSHGSMHTGNKKTTPTQVVSKPIVQDSFLVGPSNCAVEKPVLEAMATEVEAEEPELLLEEIENEDTEPDHEDEEIAEAKLKLMLRSWKRRASRKRELREQRQVAASAALNSLPLGPLVQRKREPPNMLGEFDINHALRERLIKHERSWSRLNVSEEIAGTLSGKNPAAKCLCWKIVVCSQVSKPDVAEMGQSVDSAFIFWLLSKLMPSNKDDDDDLLISSPGLAIWKKWVSGQFSSDQTCCLSVVKNMNFNNPTETVTGASAVVFLVRHGIPCSRQKADLQRLIKSIPCGSCLPLLILSSSLKDESTDTDNSSIMVNELGLLDIDKSLISSFVVISLAESLQTECPDGFFSDGRLREGLRWLASESPSQPVLHRVKTRELVLTHLSPSLEALEQIKDTEVSANSCAVAFNEALDQSLAHIDAAAKANPTGWPCPEISLLHESYPKHRFLEGFLPENGWSSVDIIGPLASALEDCKLPVFEDDLSYLSKGSNSIGEIEIQRVEFGKSLIRYLTESSNLMGFSLAVKEAGIMLQSCRLDLRGSFFHIVPNWAVIFKRILNWRLMSLSDEALSSAYVLDCPDISLPFKNLDDSVPEGDRLSSYHLNQPTLDEMIEVSFRSVPLGNGRSLQEANQVLPQTASNGEAQEAIGTDLMEDDSEVDCERRPVVADNDTREVVVGGQVNKEADRLSKLLEKCNILQNMIDDKLSVYF